MRRKAPRVTGQQAREDRPTGRAWLETEQRTWACGSAWSAGCWTPGPQSGLVCLSWGPTVLSWEAQRGPVPGKLEHRPRELDCQLSSCSRGHLGTVSRDQGLTAGTAQQRRAWRGGPGRMWGWPQAVTQVQGSSCVRLWVSCSADLLQSRSSLSPRL